jgi:hypothetical protein
LAAPFGAQTALTRRDCERFIAAQKQIEIFWITGKYFGNLNLVKRPQETEIFNIFG